MKFDIEFYELENGERPVEKFLEGVKTKNLSLWKKTLAALLKIKEREYHKMPLTEYIEPGIFSLRVKSENNIFRIFFAFEKGKRIFLLHGYVKKSQKIPRNELEIARRRVKQINE